jgi:hypothetical protein
MLPFNYLVKNLGRIFEMIWEFFLAVSLSALYYKNHLYF